MGSEQEERAKNAIVAKSKGYFLFLAIFDSSRGVTLLKYHIIEMQYSEKQIYGDFLLSYTKKSEDWSNSRV